MRWQIGKVTITQLVEIETLGGKEDILPKATPDAIRELEWLWPHFADELGNLKMSIHTFLIETPTRRIVIDTGIGNDKQGRRNPAWNGRRGPFLEQMEAAGCPVETIDTVLCTHLHVDHVGWNTILVDRRWVPTFPRARYLMGRVEFDHWSADRSPARAAIFDDSIEPVASAGLVDLIGADHLICKEISLIASPGHSPGQFSVHISSEGQDALLSADVAHHPCQMAHLEWSSTVDTDPLQSARTRNELFSRFAGTQTHILGGHFVGGTIVRSGEAFRLIM